MHGALHGHHPMTDPSFTGATLTAQPGQVDPELAAHALAAINLLDLGILVVDHKKRITFANRTARHLLQFATGLGTKSPASWANGTSRAGILSRRLSRAIS